MAPTRKSRSVKRFSTVNDVSPEKDGRNLGKSKKRVSLVHVLGLKKKKKKIHFLNCFRYFLKTCHSFVEVIVLYCFY
jgi:hypothetical protein